MRLYRRPGNELPDRSEFGPPGATFVARKGHEHELVIRAWDVGGRTGESSWAIRGTQRAFVQPIPWYSLEGEWKPGKGADDPWPAEWVLSRGEPGVKYGEMTDDLPASDSEPVLHGWYLSVAEDGLFPGGMWKYSCPPPPEQGPEGTSGYLSLDGVGFDGDGIVVNKGFDIEVYFSAGTASKVGLFQYNSTGKWIFLDSERTETPEEGVIALRASTESLGPLALARDTTPPELGSFRIGERLLADGETLRSVTREQQRGVTLPDWPSVRIDVKDLATGIPEDGLTTLLDGEPWPARWEPEDEVLVYEWWLDPGPGEHELTVQAQDGLGNASESSIRLVFPR
jgi:hypothetical protein